MRTPEAKTPEKRVREIATIQIGRQQLNMEDAAYRQMLARVSGACGVAVTSAKNLDDKQRAAVITELQRLGATGPTRPGRGKVGQHPGKPDFKHLPHMITKIEALLADMKLPWSYADAICKRQAGIAKIAWCRKEEQLLGIVAALHVEQHKRALGERIDDYLKQLGMSEAELIAKVERCPKNWRRNVKVLEGLAGYLATRIAYEPSGAADT